ncbi:MAG: ATP-binding protein [Lachnospiraceae bacterium]|nr:ATP-binding protein [Lachnospiraceae bacterium]
MIEKIKETRKSSESSPPQYECPKCKDTGVIYHPTSDGAGSCVTCGCVELKRAKKVFESSGIMEFMEVGFKGYLTYNDEILEKARSKAIDYYKHFKDTEKDRYNSILFCGQVGAGKTHLGVAISNNLIDIGVAVMYMPYRNVVTLLKQNITDEAAYYKELSKYLNARVLFVDDLLKGKITESDNNILFEIINYRYLKHLPMIVTTEKNLDELLAFDEAIGSRIIEMCKGNIVYFGRDESLNHRLRKD